jgi:hypothetical protein
VAKYKAEFAQRWPWLALTSGSEDVQAKDQGSHYTNSAEGHQPCASVAADYEAPELQRDTWLGDVSLWDSLTLMPTQNSSLKIESLEEFCEDASYKQTLAHTHPKVGAEEVDRLLFIDEIETGDCTAHNERIQREESLCFEDLGVIEVADGDDLSDDDLAVSATSISRPARVTSRRTDDNLRQSRPSDLDPKAYRKAPTDAALLRNVSAAQHRPPTPPAARNTPVGEVAELGTERVEYSPPIARSGLRPQNHVVHRAASSVRYLHEDRGSRTMYEVRIRPVLLCRFALTLRLCILYIISNSGVGTLQLEMQRLGITHTIARSNEASADSSDGARAEPLVDLTDTSTSVSEGTESSDEMDSDGLYLDVPLPSGGYSVQALGAVAFDAVGKAECEEDSVSDGDDGDDLSSAGAAPAHVGLDGNADPHFVCGARSAFMPERRPRGRPNRDGEHDEDDEEREEEDDEYEGGDERTEAGDDDSSTFSTFIARELLPSLAFSATTFAVKHVCA